MSPHANGTRLRRALHRLVLQTFVAARPQLAAAAAEVRSLDHTRWHPDRPSACPVPSLPTLDDPQTGPSRFWQALGSLGLQGPHQYAATFELVAFDIMLDEALTPWLLEVNTSPSLKGEEIDSRLTSRLTSLKGEEPLAPAATTIGPNDGPEAAAATFGMADGRVRAIPNWDGPSQNGHWDARVRAARRERDGEPSDLRVKRRVVDDMLRLSDALVEGTAAPAATPAATPADLPGDTSAAALADVPTANLPTDLSTGMPAHAPEEALLNAVRSDPTGVCRRRWKLGGCMHCPTWEDVGALCRASAERRRAGGFEALAPSDDPEWAALSAPAVVPARPIAEGSHVRPTTDELLAAWVRGETASETVASSGEQATSRTQRANSVCTAGSVLSSMGGRTRSQVAHKCATARMEAMLC